MGDNSADSTIWYLLQCECGRRIWSSSPEAKTKQIPCPKCGREFLEVVQEGPKRVAEIESTEEHHDPEDQDSA